MRKGKKRISWVWEMRNDHYGVRKKTGKHGKWGVKQDLAAWKFITQNLVATYIVTLKTNLAYFLKSILDIPYISSKLRKSKVQYFKWCTIRSWNEEVMAIWRQLHKAKGPFRNDFKIQLMNSKSNSKLPQFQIHPLPLWCFASSTFGNCILGTSSALSGPHTIRNHHFIIF